MVLFTWLPLAPFTKIMYTDFFVFVSDEFGQLLSEHNELLFLKEMLTFITFIPI